MSSQAHGLRLTLEVWRQNGVKDPGHFETYVLEDISPDNSFLEMLDLLNEHLILEGKDPVAFDHVVVAVPARAAAGLVAPATEAASILSHIDYASVAMVRAEISAAAG